MSEEQAGDEGLWNETGDEGEGPDLWALLEQLDDDEIITVEIDFDDGEGYEVA